MIHAMSSQRIGPIVRGRSATCSLVLAAGVVSVFGCTSRQADDATRELPVLRIEARDLAFTVPTEVPAGLTRIRLVNHGAAWHEALMTRLPDGVTADAYLAGARAGDTFPTGAIDFGGPGLIASMDSSEVVVDLEPGRYAVVCWSESHVKSGMIAPMVITVADRGAPAEAPAATGEVRLEEFRFVHDSVVFRQGSNVLHVRNTGQRPHDMTVYKLEPGRTGSEVREWFTTRTGTPPVRPVGGMTTLAPGHDGWVVLTLSAGTYLVTCGTPETTAEGVQIHARMGMLEVFELGSSR